MTAKRQYRTYTKEFKEEALKLIEEQGYRVPYAAEALGIKTNLPYTWKQQAEEQKNSTVSPYENEELGAECGI